MRKQFSKTNNYRKRNHKAETLTRLKAENFLRQEASADPKEISDKICLEENAEQLGESAMQKTPADKKENKSEHQVKFSRSGKRDAFNDQ